MENINNDVITYAHNSELNLYKAKIDGIISDILSQSPSAELKNILHTVYVKLYGAVPHSIDLSYDGDYLNTAPDDMYSEHGKFKTDMFTLHKMENGDLVEVIVDNDDKEERLWRTFKDKGIKDQNTIISLLGHYPFDENKNIAAYRVDETAIIFMDNCKTILYKRDHYWLALTPTEHLPEYLINNIVLEEDDDDERYFDYVVLDKHGFNTTDLPIKKQKIDIEKNYNDDIPDAEIKNFINNIDSGICILYGAPGTGKTSYIRYLMHSSKHTNFMILNSSCFDAINDTSFVDLIINNRDSVVILEDCEDLLTERMNGNSRIATLLNLSDGILGDALRLKFICTFNAKIGKIDQAVLRKGRTHIKYEFKPLCADKAKILADELNITLPPKKSNEGYTLAEIYNSDNDLVDGNINTKVGF